MASVQGGSGGRMKNLSYKGYNIITDKDGNKTVTLTGNYSSAPYVSATPGGAAADNCIAYITSIENTNSGWQVTFRTSMGEQTVRYQAWGEIKETF